MAAKPWVILGRVIRAEAEQDSGRVDFTVPVALPPRVAILATDRSAHPEPGNYDEYPYTTRAEAEQDAGGADFTVPVAPPPQVAILAADRSVHSDPGNCDKYPYVIRAEADFTIPVAPPPRVAIIAADRCAHPDADNPDEYPYIIAAGSLCLLTHFAAAPSIGTDFSDNPNETHLVLARHFDMLEGRITASAERVPDRAGHVPSLFNVGSIGLVSDDEGEYYMIAELQVSRGCRLARLVCFESGNEQWYSEDVPSPLPEGDRDWVPHGAVSVGGKVWWYDLSWGILSCDLSEIETEVVFHDLPDGRALKEATEAMLTQRCITVSQNHLRYVEIHDEEGGSMVSTWTRIMGPDGWHWVINYKMAFTEIWDDVSYQETGLPRKTPVLAVVCPSDPELVYFALEQRLFGVCVPKHRVVHCEAYDLMNMPLSPPPACSRYVLSWDLPESHAVAPGAAALDNQHSGVLKDGENEHSGVLKDRDNDLLIEIIREKNYPILPAADVLCARLVNKNWNMAYTDGSLGQIQPARGGSIPLGFILSTDRLQRSASVGLNVRRRFKGLNDNFPGRDARIIASCCGLYLIHMRNPEGMVILNPAVGQSRPVYPSVSIPESDYTGLAVTFADGSEVAYSYSVVVPYLPTFINVDAENPRIRFRTWNSQEGIWRINPSIIDLEEFSPRNAVTVGDVIYYHISRDELVSYDLKEGRPAKLDMPLEVAGIIEPALFSRQGTLGIMSYDLTSDKVHIHTLETTEWIRQEDIDMARIVERNRFAFRSLTMNLRGRAAEDEWEALVDIQLVGFVDPGWLLIRQRGGCILVNVNTDIANRVHIGNIQKIFFGSRQSSFLRLF